MIAATVDAPLDVIGKAGARDPAVVDTHGVHGDHRPSRPEGTLRTRTRSARCRRNGSHGRRDSLHTPLPYIAGLGDLSAFTDNYPVFLRGYGYRAAPVAVADDRSIAGGARWLSVTAPSRPSRRKNYCLLPTSLMRRGSSLRSARSSPIVARKSMSRSSNLLSNSGG